MTYEYVRSERRVPCWGCEKLTFRVSVDWEAHICSAECEALVDERVGRELQQEEPKTLMDQLLDSIEQARKDRHG